jgi:hypothetical protein
MSNVAVVTTARRRKPPMTFPPNEVNSRGRV